MPTSGGVSRKVWMHHALLEVVSCLHRVGSAVVNAARMRQRCLLRKQRDSPSGSRTCEVLNIRTPNL